MAPRTIRCDPPILIQEGVCATRAARGFGQDVAILVDRMARPIGLDLGGQARNP